MSETLDLEQLEQIHTWAKERLAYAQRRQQRMQMMSVMMSSYRSLRETKMAELLAGPTARVRESTLKLEALLAKSDSGETSPSGTQRMLEAAQRRTAVLREILASLERQ